MTDKETKTRAEKVEAKGVKAAKPKEDKPLEDDGKRKSTKEDASPEVPPLGVYPGQAVVGADGNTRTFAQQSQLYTDGISGVADYDLERAYGVQLVKPKEE